MDYEGLMSYLPEEVREVLNTNGNFEWVTEMPDSKLAAPRSNVLADNGSCQNPQAIKSGEYYYISGPF